MALGSSMMHNYHAQRKLQECDTLWRVSYSIDWHYLNPYPSAQGRSLIPFTTRDQSSLSDGSVCISAVTCGGRADYRWYLGWWQGLREGHWATCFSGSELIIGYACRSIRRPIGCPGVEPVDNQHVVTPPVSSRPVTPTPLGSSLSS